MLFLGGLATPFVADRNGKMCGLSRCNIAAFCPIFAEGVRVSGGVHKSFRVKIQKHINDHYLVSEKQSCGGARYARIGIGRKRKTIVVVIVVKQRENILTEAKKDFPTDRAMET